MNFSYCSYLNIDCGYIYGPPHLGGSNEYPHKWGGSNEYPQFMFGSKNKKMMYTPVNPSFTI